MIYKVRPDQTVISKRKVDRVTGIEIRFRDRRTPLRIQSMTNAKALIKAILYRMAQMGELDAETFQSARQSLVLNVHWKGEKPYIPSGHKFLGASLLLLSPLAMISGFGIADWAGKEQQRHLLGSLPPHKMTLESLIQNGPGANRHVTVTNFRPGGYAYAFKSGTWNLVWLALFPSGAQAGESLDIPVVLTSYDIGDEATLQQLLRSAYITGICSKRRSSSWGSPLGTELVKANQGSQHSSAWIIEEMGEPPRAAFVMELLTGSAVCFAAVIIFAMILFWKAA